MQTRWMAVVNAAIDPSRMLEFRRIRRTTKRAISGFMTETHRRFRMRRFAVLVALLFAVGCASAPSTAAPPTTEKSTVYSAQGGSEAVGVIPAATLHDPQRNKDIDLSIEYPIKGGPFPLII